ncbi:hypothetical protein AB4851_18940 [Burkholderia sp. 22PA0099]|uniref:hypothetical protein n=1 Tax=Burkholderia sp. 22PA0099 TaxID=3237372 RepID=UPI0039C1BF3C
MLALLLLIPLLAGLIAGARDGVLSGLAAGAAATVLELLLLFIAGVVAKRRETKRQAAAALREAENGPLPEASAASADNATNPAPHAHAAEANAAYPTDAPPPNQLTAFRARRFGDRTRPIDLLPAPLGARSAWPQLDDGQWLPGYLGAYACYQRIFIDTDARATSAAVVFRQLYDGLRGVCEQHIEVESNVAEASPEIAPLDDLPEHFNARHRADDTLFVAFRSRDAEWAGFRLGRDSFRFPLDRLAGFALNVGIPARGPGGYEIEAIFDRPHRDTEADSEWQRHGSAFQPSLPYADRHSFALLQALTHIAQLFDVRIVCSTFSDC